MTNSEREAMNGNPEISDLVRVDPDAGTPLGVQLSQQLTLLIASRQIPEGAFLPPVRELGARLGINLHTVRAAYAQLEEDGLASSRQGRRTTVLAYDRARHAGRGPQMPTFAIGVVLAAYSPFYAPLLDGIEFQSDDPSLIFYCNARDDPKLGLTYLDQLIARRVDGIIVVSAAMEGHQLGLEGAPAVVYADWPDAPGPRVNFDLENAGYAGTHHLIEHGHTRIAFVGPPTQWSNVAPKESGYRRALEHAGIEFDQHLVIETEGFDPGAVQPVIGQLLESSSPPSAVFTAGDTLAVGLIKEMTSRGIKVPDDVAIASSDDIAMASLVHPALTTVRLPAYDMGAAARRMLDQLKSEQIPEDDKIVLPTELVIRESCGCGPGGTPSS